MRELSLSGYLDGRILDLERVRLEKDKAALRNYEAAVQTLHNKIDKAHAEFKKAIRSWWNVFKLFVTWWKHNQAKKLPQPVKPQPIEPSKDELTLRAGKGSEDSVANALKALLPGNAWVLIRNYSNQKGEIDQILVGPTAIITMEIKYRKARIFCDGNDDWQEVRVDSWNNYVEKPMPMRDKKGRSPSRQILDPTEALWNFLKRRNVNVDMSPAVVLSHDNASIGICENISVRLVTLDDIEGVVWDASKKANTVVPVDDIVSLIIKDHEYWKQKPAPARHKSVGEKIPTEITPTMNL